MDRATEFNKAGEEKPREREIVMGLLWRLKQPDLVWERDEQVQTEGSESYTVSRYTTNLEKFKVIVQQRIVKSSGKPNEETHSITVEEKKGTKMGPFKSPPKQHDPIKDLYRSLREKEVRARLQNAPKKP